MKALGVTTFGRPEVLHVVELPKPHAGAGEVRMCVHATTAVSGAYYFVPSVEALRSFASADDE